MNARLLSRAHGLFNVVSGLWPLMHLPSFEAVCGPKADRWLERTVAGLLLTNGVTQLRSGPSSPALSQARRINGRHPDRDRPCLCATGAH
jgi:hypothetical protein